VITEGLRAYDFDQIGYRDFRRLTVLVRDPRTGKVVGGLYGRSELGLVYVDWLFLPEEWRRARIGSRLLAIAEDEGRRRGCTRIALTTLSVEAPGFYKKQGYDVAATIDCDPPGVTRYYTMKKL
jgi:GNAT superfamily N-acetyltransferase